MLYLSFVFYVTVTIYNYNIIVLCMSFKLFSIPHNLLAVKVQLELSPTKLLLRPANYSGSGPKFENYMDS